MAWRVVMTWPFPCGGWYAVGLKRFRLKPTINMRVRLWGTAKAEASRKKYVTQKPADAKASTNVSSESLCGRLARPATFSKTKKSRSWAAANVLNMFAYATGNLA